MEKVDGEDSIVAGAQKLIGCNVSLNVEVEYLVRPLAINIEHQKQRILSYSRVVQ